MTLSPDFPSFREDRYKTVAQKLTPCKVECGEFMAQVLRKDSSDLINWNITKLFNTVYARDGGNKPAANAIDTIIFQTDAGVFGIERE